MKSFIAAFGSTDPSSTFVQIGDGSWADASDTTGFRSAQPSRFLRRAIVVDPQSIPDDLVECTQVVLRLREAFFFTQQNGVVYEVEVDGVVRSSQVVFKTGDGVREREHLIFSGQTITRAELLSSTIELVLRTADGHTPGDRWEIYEGHVDVGYVPHRLQTYSSLTRATTEAETLLRASTNDMLEGIGSRYADVLRVQYPDCRICVYSIHRYIRPATAAEWDAYCALNAIDPEQGYTHNSGVRNLANIPPTGQWYVMNMGSAAYRQWCNEMMVASLQGRRYPPEQFFAYPPPVHEGLVDLVLWYPESDSDPGDPTLYERVLFTDEYTGTGLLYQDHCREAWVKTADYISEHEPGSDAYCNFGAMSYLNATDPNTLQVIAAARKLIHSEVAIFYTATEPNLRAETMEQRFALIASLLDGTRELLAEGYVWNTESQPNRERAKIGVSAFFLLGYQPGLVSRFFIAPEEQETSINQWEQNDVMRTAVDQLGQPLGNYTIVAGSWTKGKLYKREFESGTVLMYVRKTGQTGSEPIQVEVDEGRALNADLSLGSPTTSITLTLGEGVILLDLEQEIVHVHAPIQESVGVYAPINEAVHAYAPIEG